MMLLKHGNLAVLTLVYTSERYYCPRIHELRPIDRAFSFAADRTEHIHQVIEPALSSGKWVVCDRYIDSTFAYQYGGRRHPKEDILDIIRLTRAIEPDLTIFLDVSVKEGLSRAASRGHLIVLSKRPLIFMIV